MAENSDHGIEQRAHEDGPEYRSMAVEPSAMLGMGRLHHALLPKFHKPNTVSSQSKTSSSSHRRWEVRELSALPADYTLVATNVFVKDGSSAQVIADRICKALKVFLISIDSKNSEENSLVVETQHGLKLDIRLFGRNNIVVVEVRRRAGCSFEFRDAAKTILRSSEGLVGKDLLSIQKRRFTIPCSLPRRSPGAYHECVQDDFKIAYSMLHSTKADENMLALESLRQMIKSSEANELVAKLVLGNNDCLKQLLVLLDSNNKNKFISGMESSRKSSIMSRKILEILANACESITERDLAMILSMNDYRLKSRSFLTLLLSPLHEASRRPHDAFQAVRCLRYLMISKEVQSLMVELSAKDVVSSACVAGFTCHEELEQESNELIAQLQDAC